ncbi:MAG TPA: hypothetical protein DE314_07235 [Sulfitobacter sp.]|nr:hypothetical protein [Sulfitobacter sp.]
MQLSPNPPNLAVFGGVKLHSLPADLYSFILICPAQFVLNPPCAAFNILSSPRFLAYGPREPPKDLP